MQGLSALRGSMLLLMLLCTQAPFFFLWSREAMNPRRQFD